MQQIKLCEFIGFCSIFFRNDLTVRLKRANLNWASPVSTIAEIEKTELYKIYKNHFIKSVGISFYDDILNIYITC